MHIMQVMGYAIRRRNQLIRSVRVIAAFALAGSVFGGLLLGWLPLSAGVDMHAVGAALGGIVGLTAKVAHKI